MSRPVKICIVSLYAYHYFNPKSNSRFGGAELQLYLLATELAKDKNFEVHFIVGDFGQPKNELIKGVHLYKFYNPVRKIKYTGMVLGLFRLVRALYKTHADVYIQRGAGMEAGVSALFCALIGRKFIYMVAHDEDLLPNKPKWIPDGWYGTLRWKLFKLGLKFANVVVVQHQRQLENLKKYMGKTGFIRMSAHPMPASIPNQKREFVLWVARCEDWKQPEIFLQLAQSLPQEKFVMVMPEANTDVLYNTIVNTVPLIPNLEFKGTVPADQIDSYFQRAKVFVNTSKTEGFPNTFVQAARNGTPIVSLNIDPDGMLSEYGIGKCAHGNFGQLKNSVTELSNNQGEWDRLSKNAFKYALEHHDLSKIIESDKQLIKNIA